MRKKKPVHKVEMTDGKRQIIQQLLQEYDIASAEDIQKALKDLLGGTIKEMMESEMQEHLGYEKSARNPSDDSRNGYKPKQVNSRYGSFVIDVPQDRNSSFEPQVVKKCQKDISGIDQKIIAMYAKGMTTRQISVTLEDIYGFEVSESFISDVTDKLLPQIEDWQKRPLSEVYPILFIDAIHYSVRDILILCSDGLSGIKEAIGTAFPEAEYQRCIVHQIRNSMKYISYKDRKPMAKDFKTIYQAVTEEYGYRRSSVFVKNGLKSIRLR